MVSTTHLLGTTAALPSDIRTRCLKKKGEGDDLSPCTSIQFYCLVNIQILCSVDLVWERLGMGPPEDIQSMLCPAI